MTLLDAKTPKPPSGLLKFGLPLLITVILIGGLLYVRLRNYSEERAVARFLTTLHEGNYEEAYRLWRPSASYTHEDFLRGWGEQGDYGKIREFQILGSESRGSTVIVLVRINNVEPPLELVVDRETKGLSYSPF